MIRTCLETLALAGLTVVALGACQPAETTPGGQDSYGVKMEGGSKGVGVSRDEIEAAFEDLGFVFFDVTELEAPYNQRSSYVEGDAGPVDLRGAGNVVEVASLALYFDAESPDVAHVRYLATFTEVLGLDWKETLDLMGESLELRYEPGYEYVLRRQGDLNVAVRYDGANDLVLILVLPAEE